MNASAFFSRKVPLSTITIWILVFHIVIMIVGLLLLGPSSLMSSWSVALTVLLDLLLVAALRCVGRNAIAHTIVLAWFSIMFFLPRLTAFLIFPARNITFVAIEPFAIDEVSKGLLYVVAGTVALIAGFIIGGRVPGLPTPVSRDTPPLIGLLIYWVLCFLAAIYISYVLNINVYGDPANWGSRMGWLTRIFDTDAALLLTICVLVVGRYTGPKIILLATCIILWTTMTVVSGSRGAGLRIFILIGLAAIAAFDDVSLSPRRFVAVFVGAFALSSAIYPLGTWARLAFGISQNPGAQMISDWSRLRVVEEDSNSQWFLRRIVNESAVFQSAASMASPIITRLGLIDYPLQIINRPADPVVIAKYLAPEYSLKNFANNMVPGEIFDGNDIMSSRIFTMAYRGYDEQHVRNNFLSEPWTAWGYSWLMGGGAVGGIALMVAMAALIQAGYSLLKRMVGAMAAPYAAAAWLFLPTASGLLQLFGLDHWLTITAHFAIAMGLAWCFFVVAAWLCKSEALVF